MSKDKNAKKKSAKKEPQRTLKEKRAAKAARRNEKTRVITIDVQ